MIVDASGGHRAIVGRRGAVGGSRGPMTPNRLSRTRHHGRGMGGSIGAGNPGRQSDGYDACRNHNFKNDNTHDDFADDPETVKEWVEFEVPLKPLTFAEQGGTRSLENPGDQYLATTQGAALRYVRDAIVAEIRRLGGQ
jgi:hypothetical protein